VSTPRTFALIGPSIGVLIPGRMMAFAASVWRKSPEQKGIVK
jgi:hypothetical protein